MTGTVYGSNRLAESEDAISVSQALRSPTQLRLSAVFAATTVAAGAVVTFLPLAATSSIANLAALALFIEMLWLAGTQRDVAC